MTRSAKFLPMGLTLASLALGGCLCVLFPEPGAKALAPQTPSGVSVSTGDIREAVVTWTVAGKPAGSIRIERSTRETGPFCKVGVVDAKQGRFSDSGTLHDSTAYYYRLVATAPCAKDSAPSTVVRSVTAPPPDPPTDLSASVVGPRAVRLSWKASASAGVLRYRVERAPASAPEVWSLRGHTACCLFEDAGKRSDGLAEGGEYLYRVSPVNRAGATGQPTAAVAITVPQ